MIWDAHVYVGRDAYADQSVTPDELVTLMDRHDIQRAMIAPLVETPGPVTDAHAVVAQAVADHPGRLIALARLDPRYGADAVDRLRHAIHHEGMRGVLFDPVTVRTPPYHPGVVRLLGEAAGLNVPVLIPCGEGYLGMPEGIIRLAELLPDLKIIVGAMATCVHATRLIEIVRPYPTIWLETSVQQSPARVRLAVDALGSARVVFGSAYPWSHPLPELRKITQARLDVDEERDVLGRSLRRLLGEE